MNFNIANDYYKSNKVKYPYDNNPSNPVGVGYLSTYDTKKERLIISKKDFQNQLKPLKQNLLKQNPREQKF